MKRFITLTLCILAMTAYKKSGGVKASNGTNTYIEYTSATAGTNIWDRQAIYTLEEQMDGNSAYTLSADIKSSVDNLTLGLWLNDGKNTRYEEGKTITTEWNTYTWNISIDSDEHDPKWNPNTIQFVFGSLEGTICLDNLKLVKAGTTENLITNGDFSEPSINGWSTNWQGPSFALEKDITDKKYVTIAKYDYEDGTKPGGWGPSGWTGSISTADNGYNSNTCAKVSNPTATNYWDVQLSFEFQYALTIGETYYLKFYAKASEEKTARAIYQNPDSWAERGNFPNFTLTTDWKEYNLKGTVTGDNAKRILISLGDIQGDIYFDDVEISYATTPNVDINIGEMGYATFCPAAPLDFTNSTDIAAYTASVSDKTVILTKVNKVAIGEGVLLRSLATGEDRSVTATIPVIDSADKVAGNEFIGVLGADITIYETDTDGNTNYVLSKESEGIGFYKAQPESNGGTLVAAGKAYLPVSANNMAKGLTLSFDSETTGISEITTKATAADNVYYNISGQRVAKPTKGLYIVNGKKVVMK